MYKLKYADYNGTWEGFTLKKSFWYGVDTESGQYIATSGWECAGNVAMYFKTTEGWEMSWVDIDSDFRLEGTPEHSTEGKMSFAEWLEDERGISPEEYDECYSGTAAREVEDAYGYYLYDGLPLFVQRTLEEK